MLRTKSIRLGREPDDGIRISVMSRHTLTDGVTPDPEITPNLYDDWWPELAPPPKLIGDHYKRDLPWDEFEQRYIDHIRSPQTAKQMENLISLVLVKSVTLLCVEDTPQRCHRRLLAQECLLLSPGIIVDIR